MSDQLTLPPEGLVFVGLPSAGLQAIADYFLCNGKQVFVNGTKQSVYRPLQNTTGVSAKRVVGAINIMCDYSPDGIKDGIAYMVYCDPWDYILYAQNHYKQTKEEALLFWKSTYQNVLKQYEPGSHRIISSYAFLQQPLALISTINRQFGLQNNLDTLAPQLDAFYHESHYHSGHTIELIRYVKADEEAIYILIRLHELSILKHDDRDPYFENRAVTAQVVIPCYNLGHLLDECLAGLERSLNNSFDITIVNDGSTSEDTQRHIKRIESLGYNVVHQANQGLCATLNNGVRLLDKPYVIILSADDKMDPSFISKAVKILDQQQGVGVVYANPTTFESRYNMPVIPDFDADKLLTDNYIVATAVYRKNLWEACGGYDPAADGNEDWDMWVGCYEKGAVFYHLNEYLFYYRIRQGSKLGSTITPEGRRKFTSYIANKHKDVYARHIGAVIGNLQAHLFHFINQQQVNTAEDFVEIRAGKERLGFVGTLLYRLLRKAGHLSIRKKNS
jgi:glycosyltransferase involved in cell wall biosynthesis